MGERKILDGKLTLKLFDEWLESLKNCSKVLREQDQAGKTLVPAAEWLLDNINFIKEQALFVQQKLAGNQLLKLPRLDENSAVIRIFDT